MTSEDAAGERESREPSLRSARLVRYVLLQLPDLALLGLVLLLLHRGLGLPTTVAWIIVALWVVKSVVLYPVVQRLYRQGPVRRDPGVGSLGVVQDRLDPVGYARFTGELWRCRPPRGAGPIEQGATVRVHRVDGLTLVVEEAHQDDDLRDVVRTP